MINKYSKVTKTPVPEETPKPSYLASLFKPPEDEQEAEAELDRLYGRQPRNTHNSSSFTK